jgi:hypothetical protein
MRRTLSALAALLLLCCSSGGRDGFGAEPGTEPPGGPPPGAFGDAGTPPSGGVCTEDIDVVLVLDVSSSMGFVLDKLDAEIDKVVNASNALKDGAHFGLVLFVDNVALVTTGDLEGGKVHSKATTLRAAFTSAKATYTTPNRNPGDGPTGPTTQNPICEEDSLDALNDAATLFPWRANAARVAILVSDDTFLEKGDNYGDRDGDGLTNKTDFPREGNYPARFTFDETVAALAAQKVRVFSFTRITPPGFLDLDKCGTGRRHGAADAITFGWSKPYKGKDPIPTKTGGKNFDLDQVKKGQLSLADTINEVVLESHCGGPK